MSKSSATQNLNPNTSKGNDDNEDNDLLTCNEELPSSPTVAIPKATVSVEEKATTPEEVSQSTSQTKQTTSSFNLSTTSKKSTSVPDIQEVPSGLSSPSIPSHRLMENNPDKSDDKPKTSTKSNTKNKTKATANSNSKSNTDLNSSDKIRKDTGATGTNDGGLDQIVAASNLKTRRVAKSPNKNKTFSKNKHSKDHHHHHHHHHHHQNHHMQLARRQMLPLNKPIIHNLASLPSWTANMLTYNSQHICSKWDHLRLGIDSGTVALNEYLNAVQDINTDTNTNTNTNINTNMNNNNRHTQNDRMSKLTPPQVLEIIETLRPKTCKPPLGSALHNIDSGGKSVDDEIMSDVDYDDHEVIDIDNDNEKDNKKDIEKDNDNHNNNNNNNNQNGSISSDNKNKTDSLGVEKSISSQVQQNTGADDKNNNNNCDNGDNNNDDKKSSSSPSPSPSSPPKIQTHQSLDNISTTDQNISTINDKEPSSSLSALSTSSQIQIDQKGNNSPSHSQATDVTVDGKHEKQEQTDQKNTSSSSGQADSIDIDKSSSSSPLQTDSTDKIPSSPPLPTPNQESTNDKVSTCNNEENSTERDQKQQQHQQQQLKDTTSNHDNVESERPEIPWKSLMNVYELMRNQDSLYSGKTPLQRRKVHYMEHPDVVKKLRSLENKASELKLRSESMKRKQQELGLLPNKFQKRKI